MPVSIPRALRPLLAAPLLAAGLAAGPASAATEEEFLAACLTAAGSDATELCTCKAEQAVALADETMLEYIIMRMTDPQGFSTAVKEGEVPEEVIERWPYYVRDSNAICLAEPDPNAPPAPDAEPETDAETEPESGSEAEPSGDGDADTEADD